MTYDMPYGHRTYHFFYTMLCIGPHFNCIHDTRRGPHEMPMRPSGRHLPIPGLDQKNVSSSLQISASNALVCALNAPTANRKGSRMS